MVRGIKNLPGTGTIATRSDSNSTALTYLTYSFSLSQVLNFPLQMLWNKDFKMNTVHVRDLARGIWHLCNNGKPGETYNLSDKGDTSGYHSDDIKIILL